MKLRRRQFLRLAAGALTLPALLRLARAQAHPTRTNNKGQAATKAGSGLSGRLSAVHAFALAMVTVFIIAFGSRAMADDPVDRQGLPRIDRFALTEAFRR